MVRQKHYHDRKLKWHYFEVGEEVYVYFPRRKPSTSPKFTSFWRGPFKVVKKISDLTYLVNCGLRGLDQVIHVDRMRKKRAQILSGENNEPQAKLEDPEDSGSIDSDDNIQSRENMSTDRRPIRTRKPPIT